MSEKVSYTPSPFLFAVDLTVVLTVICLLN